MKIKTSKLSLIVIALLICGSFFIYQASHAQMAWRNVTPDGGFGDPNNSWAYHMIEFNGEPFLSVGTIDGPSTARVYKYEGGTDWTLANSSTFGDANNIAAIFFEEFEDYLYVGVKNKVTGAELWRTEASGSLPYSDWEQVNADGFGDADSRAIIGSIEFDGYLYVGLRNETTGGQLWRTQAVGGPPFTDWEQVEDDGFGDINNNQILLWGVIGDYIYTTTNNKVEGSEMWRSSNGTDWTKVVDGGFGDSNNYMIWNVIEYDNKLYAGSSSNNTGSLWVSDDGEDWELLRDDGLGDESNMAIGPIISNDDYLYLTTYNLSTGVEIWRYDGTTYTQVNDDSFGTSGEELAATSGHLNYNGGILFGTFSQNPEGAQVWAEFPPTLTDLSTVLAEDGSKVTISFDVDDSEDADNILGLVEYNLGDGWIKATLSETDADTTADQGDPKVENDNDYQIGTSDGYIETSDGENVVSVVWDVATDIPASALDLLGSAESEVQLRVRLDDQILPSEYVESDEITVGEGDCEISGHVFNDLNKNGVQDEGEGGISGVVIELLDENRNKLNETTTTEIGNFTFRNLACGATYIIREVDPSGYSSISNEISIELTSDNSGATNLFADYPTTPTSLPTTGKAMNTYAMILTLFLLPLLSSLYALWRFRKV